MVESFERTNFSIQKSVLRMMRERKQATSIPLSAQVNRALQRDFVARAKRQRRRQELEQALTRKSFAKAGHSLEAGK